MSNDFIVYRKFTDIESAEDFAGELSKNGIKYLLLDNNHSYVKLVGYNMVDFAVGVNIREQDFAKAELVLEKYYAAQIVNVDRSYHLFEFTDQELKNIVFNPFDWGDFDFQLAKHILKERGIEVTDQEIKFIKSDKIAQLSQKEEVGNYKIIMGYILALVFPLAGTFIGITIKYNRKILPNGQKFYINTEQDRKHAQRIILISLVWYCLAFIYLVFIRT